MSGCKSNKKGYPLSVHRSPIVSEDRFRRVAPKFLVPELGALFLVRKSGKVRDEERERDRGESSRLLVSAANVSKDPSRLISIISVNVPLLFYG